MPARRALAGDKVRFVGDPVALVVAETRAQAVDAAELVDVDYDELPVVADMEAALADDAPLQFEALGSNVAAPARDKDALRPVRGRRPRGPASGWSTSASPPPPSRATRSSSSPTGDRADRLGLHAAPAHGPRPARRRLGRTNDDVRVVAPHVGGAFGGKAGIGTDHAAIALAAVRLGRPVKWTETRSEAMLSMQGRGQVQFAELGLTAEGRIVGLRLRVLGECGAYAGFGGALAVGPTYLMAQGVYDVPAAAVRRPRRDDQHRSVGAFRGAGGPRRPPASSG